MPNTTNFPCLKVPVTNRDFARLMRIGEPTVSDLRKRGVLQDGATAQEWILAYVEQLRAAAAGRGEGEGALREARIREANAKAQKAEIESAQALRALVPAADVERQLRGWAARGAQAIDSAERRIVDALQSEYGITIEDRHVRDHLLAAQRDIAAYPRDAGADDDGGGEGVGTP